MANTIDEYLNRVVHTECTPSDWRLLESRFSTLRTHELERVAVAFNLAPDADWRECLDAARYSTWARVIAVYERQTGRSFE